MLQAQACQGKSHFFPYRRKYGTFTNVLDPEITKITIGLIYDQGISTYLHVNWILSHSH